MNRQLLKDTLGWGFLLWLCGYVLGIILFMFVPISMVGWIIMPIGTVVTVWVLLKKIKINYFRHYISLAFIWTLIAISFDYLFLVSVFKPADGYYKLDVYVYYLFTFILPLLLGFIKNKYEKSPNS